MTIKPTAPRVKLDWSRLLGFDQATGTGDRSAALKLSDPRLVKLGAKPGVKGGGMRRKNAAASRVAIRAFGR